MWPSPDRAGIVWGLLLQQGFPHHLGPGEEGGVGGHRLIKAHLRPQRYFLWWASTSQPELQKAVCCSYTRLHLLQNRSYRPLPLCIFPSFFLDVDTWTLR